MDERTADVVVTWNWAAQTVVNNFDPTTGTIFVGWLNASEIVVSETADGVVFTLPNNGNSTVTLTGVTLASLSPANFTIRDPSAEAEILGLIGPGTMPGHGMGHGDGPMTGDGPPTGHGPGHQHQHQHVYINLNTPAQVIDGFLPSMGDMIEIEGDVTADNFLLFEESGDALGQTVRVAITNGAETKQIVFTGFGLDALTLANITGVNADVQNEIATTLGALNATPVGDARGFDLSYDNDGSNPPPTTGVTDNGGTKFKAEFNADDIVGFRPGIDELDFGGTSVHGMIVTKSPAGEIVIDNPWGPDAQIVQGVTYQNVTIDDFGIVGNEHFRQDMGGVVSWELGLGPREADTVYIRSHEYGVHEVVDNFDPTADKISFLYFGTRERLSVEDTPAGLVISSLPSGQSVTFTGVTKAELVPGLVEFHFDQVMEDNLEAPFGFDQNAVTLVDRTMLLTPAAPAGVTTDGFQTRTGDMTRSIYEGLNPDPVGDPPPPPPPAPTAGPGTGPVVEFGAGPDSFAFSWSWGSTTTVRNFDTSQDTLDFVSFNAAQLAVSETGGNLVFEVLGNGGDFTVIEGIQAEDLSMANLTAPGWSTILDGNSALLSALIDLGFDLS